MSEELRAVENVLAQYFDALHCGDGPKMESVFHPQGRLFSATGNKFIELSVADYVKILEGRPSSESRGDARHDRILSLTLSSPTAVHARVQAAYLPKLFTDDLTFIQHEGEWRIVAKVYDWEEIGV
ncbi:nuclear transport factor 2 family protein [Streptomyces sp. WAC05858]|uniref:Nuclear transport factor 2 family protein n=2 Tax=Streptomyces TaxID=1883 RepID=A0ABP3M8D0_9ACTN|nr:nuclear transport factor 2 family protein [Streptomyces sp. WAC05858]